MNVQPPLWLRETGPDSDIVLSTRCRVARNLDGFPFPWRAGELESKEAAESVLLAAERSGVFRDSSCIRGADVNGESAVQLVRWRYASRDWIVGGRHRWLLISADTALSLLVNEEDHVRIQSIYPGLLVESVMARAHGAARGIETAAQFASRPGIGFLTASLTNAGTGIRVSVLLHLAGLAALGGHDLEQVLQAARLLGCAVRGLYGEGSSGTGELFQVSNMYTWGVEPEQIADRVSSATAYIVDAERRARHKLFGDETGRAKLADWSCSALKSLYEEEAPPERLLQWMSTLRLAAAEGVLPADLADTAEWISIAGSEAAEQPSGNTARERFLAISRTSALRQKLRHLII